MAIYIGREDEPPRLTHIAAMLVKFATKHAMGFVLSFELFDDQSVSLHKVLTMLHEYDS